MQKYFSVTKKYYYSIFFIIPFLIIYEIGLFYGVLGKNINGADALLRLFFYVLFQILGIGFSRILFAALIIFFIIFLLYILFLHRAKIKAYFFFLMLAESLLLAIGVGIIIHLFLSGRFPQFFTLEPNRAVVAQLAITGIRDFWAKIVASIGAGIFEELVFRAALIHLFYTFWKRGIYKKFGTDMSAMIKSSLLSSVVFALMHLGSVESLFGLIPIFMGSLLFSCIYLYRGYGIAAGTHVFYDIYLMFGILS